MKHVYAVGMAAAKKLHTCHRRHGIDSGTTRWNRGGTRHGLLYSGMGLTRGQRFLSLKQQDNIMIPNSGMAQHVLGKTTELPLIFRVQCTKHCVQHSYAVL
jgi:hypothetical protein